jgi:protein-S-isoprenylcysteine O-methyltransferase Ste14
MAKSLNKTRMRDSRILVVLTIFAGVFCKTLYPNETWTHESMDFVGYFMVAVCAIGRIYCSAFIGGKKNERLITWGPYSLSRNPLYFFSMLGAAGIGLMSTSILAFTMIVGGFFAIYRDLIRREEEFLLGKFGQTYMDYAARVPRLIPSFRNYTCPEELVFQPQYLTMAVRDAVWWFVIPPLFELAEILQQKSLITPVMRLF